MKSLIVLAMTVLLSVSLTAGKLTPQEINQVKGAEKLTRMKRCEDALSVLRPYAEKHPDNLIVIQALKKAYLCEGRADEARQLLLNALPYAQSGGQKFDLLIEIGSLYLKKGLKDSADLRLREGIGLMPEAPQVFERVAREYMYNGYYADAVAMFYEGREMLGDCKLYASSLGDVHEIMRNYGDAAREYFQMLEADSSRYNYVSTRMTRLIGLDAEEEYLTGLQESLEKLTKEHPRNAHAHRFYGEFLISAGRLDDAFERFALVDNLGNGKGRNMHRFCVLAAENGDYRMVEKGCMYLSSHYPDSPQLIPTLFILGNSYYNAEHYDDAVQVFERIYSTGKTKRDKSEALFYLGHASYNGRHDPQAALEVFERLIDEYGFAPIKPVASLYIADCNLSLGRIELADSLYGSIPLKSLPQEYQEQLLFRQGELKFFIGEYDAARLVYGNLMRHFPKSVYVNDCLRRIMLITEHTGMEVLTLKLLSSALFATFRFDFDSALVYYDELKDRPGAVIQDLAWFQAGGLYQSLDKAEAALVQYDSLISRFPESFYTPFAEERRGDIYAEMLGDYHQAEDIYRNILLDYDKSLNQESVRKKLRRIKRLLDSLDGIEGS